MNKIWMNGKIVPENKALVPVMDRGFLYGDGVYEAVRVYQGRIFRAEKHWKRLDGSKKGIGLKAPWSHADLTRACESVVKANRLQESLIRINISRGVGKMGYDPATCGRPTLALIPSHVRDDLREIWKKGVKVSIPNVRRNHIRALSPAIKHTNCLNGILALLEALKTGAFEGVFLNLDGFLAEGTISNIFFVKNNVLKTPSLDCGILDGVSRDCVIELAKRSQIRVMEGRFKPEELLRADEAFLTSTTMEAMPIIQVDGKKIGTGRPGSMTRFLHGRFRATIEKELKIQLPPL